MVLTDPYEFGRKNMEQLLSELDIAFDPFLRKSYALVVPEVHPSLIARGTNSLVFSLPPVAEDENTIYLVGKTFKYTERRTFRSVPEGELHLIGKNTAFFPGGFGLEMTLHWLEEMEIEKQGVEVPRIEEYHIRIDKGTVPLYIYFTITRDLRENGKYEVGDAAAHLILHPQRFKKGIELRETYYRVCDYILEECKARGLVIHPAGHGTIDDPLPAISQMFLVQHDSEGTAKLIVGDLNHVVIHQKDYQFGSIPDFLQTADSTN